MAKIRALFFAEKKIGDQDQEQTMHYRFLQRMEKAENEVIRDPGHRNPPRPVAAPKHEDATNDRRDPKKQNEDHFVLKCLLRLEIAEMVNKAHRARRDEQATHDRDCEWSLFDGTH